MAYKIDIQRLNKQELTYELKIRGLVDVGSVDQMRDCLRNLMRLENTDNSLTYPEYECIFEEDAKVLDAKAKEINDLVDDLDSGRKSGPALKIETKIAHTLKRCDRLRAVEDTQVKQKSALIARIMQLISKYEKKCSDLDASLNRLPQHASTPVSVADNHDTNEHISTSIKPVPVNKWNLKFNGDCKEMSVNAFLERVEELRVARHLSKTELFNSALDLFTGRALIWFRAAKKRCVNWESLTVLLKEEFQPPDYDERLLDEIKHRTQGKNESVGLFIAVMTNMFERMSEPVEESKQLKIILRNMSPFYQSNLSLTNIETVSDLLKYCKRLEAKKYDIDNFTLPTRTKHELEPDLAYVSTEKDVSLVAQPSTCTQIFTITCWNCHKSGHRSSQCQEQKQKHCYRCGNAGFTVRDCPKCTSSGNGRRGN